LLGVETHLLLPIEWLDEGKLRFLDQTRLPQEEVWLETADYREVAEAICQLRLRGAPLIGIAAAYGLALASLTLPEDDAARALPRLKETAAELAATRPTAVNLAWALDRLLARVASTTEVEAIKSALLDEAHHVHEEDVAANRRLGRQGAALLPQGANVLTHCNAGSLATGGYGTALGVVRSAWETGKLRHVYATETRPLLQGARLTAWELSREGIPFTLIVDSAAGSLLQGGQADAVVVGADRITANGDVANKIGTYSLAVLARENKVPFYVAAPTSTIDLSLATGEAIPIEERSAQEVTSLRGTDLAPEGTAAANPAFDVTPHDYITAIITENGVAREPYEESLASICQAEATSSG
jgi:methylthioribose-1-phosphate isomerase